MPSVLDFTAVLLLPGPLPGPRDALSQGGDLSDRRDPVPVPYRGVVVERRMMLNAPDVRKDNRRPPANGHAVGAGRCRRRGRRAFAAAHRSRGRPARRSWSCIRNWRIAPGAESADAYAPPGE